MAISSLPAPGRCPINCVARRFTGSNCRRGASTGACACRLDAMPGGAARQRPVASGSPCKKQERTLVEQILAEQQMSARESAAPSAAALPALPPDALIIVPVRNTVLFPGLVLPITLGRPKSIAAAQQAVRDQRQVGILL